MIQDGLREQGKQGDWRETAKESACEVLADYFRIEV